MPTLQRGRVLYRVRAIRSPYMREYRGLRVELALPNMSGTKPFTDISVPSFDPPYFVGFFGDFESWEALHKKWSNMCRTIFRMGFEEIEEYKAEDYRDETPTDTNPDQDDPLPLELTLDGDLDQTAK